MKLTPSQQHILKEYLNRELTYRETFDEIQDHILSALEHYLHHDNFETAFRNIINTQFGGTAGLRLIEKQYRASAVAEMRKRYFKHVLNMFAFPSVIYFAIASVAAFIFFNYWSFNLLANIAAFVIISNVPGIINIIRYYRTGYNYRTVKPSVADDGFKFIRYFPGVVFAVFMFYLWCINFNLPDLLQGLNPAIVTVAFMAYILHASSFFKMYKEEFKFNMAK